MNSVILLLCLWCCALPFALYTSHTVIAPLGSFCLWQWKTQPPSLPPHSDTRAFLRVVTKRTKTKPNWVQPQCAYCYLTAYSPVGNQHRHGSEEQIRASWTSHPSFPCSKNSSAPLSHSPGKSLSWFPVPFAMRLISLLLLLFLFPSG